MQPILMKPVGMVRSTRKSIADDHWDKEKAYIELNRSEFSEGAFQGLSDFSHVEILFYMHQVDPNNVEKNARHPRNNMDWPMVGIFAQRGKNRPNQIGSTVCKILKIEDGLLYVDGLDAVDGTPVLDIKPWVEEFGPREKITQPTWISRLMQNYWRS